MLFSELAIVLCCFKIWRYLPLFGIVLCGFNIFLGSSNLWFPPIASWDLPSSDNQLWNFAPKGWRTPHQWPSDILPIWDAKLCIDARISTLYCPGHDSKSKKNITLGRRNTLVCLLEERRLSITVLMRWNRPVTHVVFAFNHNSWKALF